MSFENCFLKPDTVGEGGGGVCAEGSRSMRGCAVQQDI